VRHSATRLSITTTAIREQAERHGHNRPYFETLRYFFDALRFARAIR
jgi:hypothetical protein